MWVSSLSTAAGPKDCSHTVTILTTAKLTINKIIRFKIFRLAVLKKGALWLIARGSCNHSLSTEKQAVPDKRVLGSAAEGERDRGTYNCAPTDIARLENMSEFGFVLPKS